MNDHIPLVSAPALAAALRIVDRLPAQVTATPILNPETLVPMYRIGDGPLLREAEDAARTVGDVAERLRRLPGAYGEWRKFEPGPYFDLTGEQWPYLLTIDERVSTVHVDFYADQLLPSFARAAAFLTATFAPEWSEIRFDRAVQVEMAQRWTRLVQVLEAVRDLLHADVGFLAVNGAEEERQRRRAWWTTVPGSGLLPVLTPDLATIPTLSLSLDFPLPAFRQPGRLRRLRRHREQWARRHRPTLRIG